MRIRFPSPLSVRACGLLPRVTYRVIFPTRSFSLRMVDGHPEIPAAATDKPVTGSSSGITHHLQPSPEPFQSPGPRTPLSHPGHQSSFQSTVGSRCSIAGSAIKSHFYRHGCGRRTRARSTASRWSVRRISDVHGGAALMDKPETLVQSFDSNKSFRPSRGVVGAAFQGRTSTTTQYYDRLS